MAFIRIKNITNKSYAYLVETIKTKNGPRQKVIEYLGRVFIPEKKEERDQITGANSKEFLSKIVYEEFKAHDISKEITIKNSKIQKRKKNIILKLNNGYLCSFTIKRIASFKKSENIEKDGYALAKHFLEAGLPISQEEFVHFYTLLDK